MNVNAYLNGIIIKNTISDLDRSKVFSRVRPLYREIRKWANEYLQGIVPSGSYSKGTAIRGKVDIDLLISLKNQTPNSLKEIFNSLHEYFKVYDAKKQNVSIGIIYQGIKVDLVPAKKMPNVIYPHSIYVSKFDTWTKTNIHKHINLIKKSSNRNAIKLFKIWRDLHGVEVPSFLLELTVLKALKGKSLLKPDRKFLTVLKYLIEEFRYDKIYDPANSSNVVSDTINDEEKALLTKTALVSYESKYWERIVWGLYEKSRTI